MSNQELSDLTEEQLLKKAKDQKTFMFLFVLCIAGLLFFNIRDYLAGHEKLPMTIITICAIGGLFSIIPGYKKIKEEISRRA